MIANKRRFTTALARYLMNPLVKLAVRARVGRGWAILETRGRKSGLPRQNPVGNGLIGDTFWIVAEHGPRAGYVRNIRADPQVRVLVNGAWRTGTAHPLPDDDPVARQRQLPSGNARVVRLMGTDLLTVRIDLDPE